MYCETIFFCDNFISLLIGNNQFVKTNYLHPCWYKTLSIRNGSWREIFGKTMQTTQKFLTCKIKFGLHAIFNKFPGIYSLAVPNREDVNVFNIIPGIITSIPQLSLCKLYYCIYIKRSILCLLQGKIVTNNVLIKILNFSF